MFCLNVSVFMKFSFDNLKDSDYQTRNKAINDVGRFDSVESPLILRDIVISVETTSSQAEERGHSLLDEMHILPVHGLLHLLGFDHEISDEAEAEMEKEEELLLNA
ncbi:endoribonuclease YBEY, chloroplastic-like [Capsicum galapagoense]